MLVVYSFGIIQIRSIARFLQTRADKLQKLQNRAARIITRADYSIRTSDVLNSLEWPNLEERRKRHFSFFLFVMCVTVKDGISLQRWFHCLRRSFSFNTLVESCHLFRI